MSKLYSSHKRFIGLGLMSALVIALAVLGTLWGFDQRASAQADGVTLVHVNPDGADYTGNPYCPDTLWVNGKPTVNPDHDCNNITSQNHVIRTDGWSIDFVDPVEDDWNIENFSGAVATIIVQGECGTLDEVTGRALWDDDDGDGLVDEDPDECANSVNDDPLDDALVNDGCPTVGATAEVDADCADALDDDGDGAVNDGCPAVSDTGPPHVGEPLDNDGDGEVDEDPAGSANDDEQCVVIHSSTPGETRVTLAYDVTASGAESGDDCLNNIDDDGDGAVNDGCPAQVPEAADTECDDALDDDEDTFFNDGCPAVGAIVTGHVTGPVVKEWDSLVDSVILKEGDLEKVGDWYLPKDVNNDGRHDTDDEHELDRQSTWQDHGVVFDEALKRIRSPEPIQITEIVHGEHEVLINSVSIVTHQPTQGALVLAEIESERNCTFFTDETGTADYGNSRSGVSDNLGRVTVYIDTVCEEQAIIHFYAQYPNLPGSLREGLHEWIGINWTTIELAKQPQIRWAGEEIVLEKRWALPDGPYEPNEICGPDEDEVCDPCPYAGSTVKYIKLDGPGGLVQGLPDKTGTTSEPDVAWTEIDSECISRALYSSEEQGQVDVEAVVQGDLGPENKHGFLVWYLKVYQTKLTNVDGERDEHNAGDWSFGDGEDTEGDTLNVSADTLLRVKVKGWFFGGNLSGRGAVCVDLDGDGDGDDATTDDEPGLPYPVTNEDVGCPDAGDEMVENGHWVLPDDLVDDPDDVDPNDGSLAGPDAINTRPNWDVMSEPDDASTGAIGPKSTLDSHDPDDQTVPWLDRTTVVPDGEITDADAIMPPLKIRASIADDDAGFLKEALKGVVYGSTNDYHSIMIPAHEEIPAWVNNGGYDWASYDLPGCPDADDDGISDGVTTDCEVDDLCPADWDPTNGDLDSDDIGDVCDDDIDGDTVLNAADNCPFKSNADQDDGDGDGIGDDCDDNPAAAGPASTDLDSDGDTVIDSLDNCRTKSNADQKDSDGDLFGDACDAHPNLVWWLTAPVPYPFWTIINKFGAPNPYYIEFYTDNRGEGMLFANGDYNLSYDDCRTDPVSGAPDCSPGDVVGESNITVIGDYPYFRKHSAVLSNPVVKTWEWGGFKRVTAERIDANHTAIIAHLVDRDGYCKYEVKSDPTASAGVTTSPSLNPVQGEEIEFILNTEVGSIISVSPNGLYNPPAPHDPLTDASVTGLADGTMINRSEAVALAEDERVLDYYDEARLVFMEDECQAWIVIEHPLGAELDVSVRFHDPEGLITRHWPPSELLVNLVLGWNDSCFVDEEATVEQAMADFIDDVLAVYRYNNTDKDWDSYFPGRCEDQPELCDLESIESYDQLFILMNAGATWTTWTWVQQISAPPANVDLVGASAADAVPAAWNSVCYAGVDKTAEEATSDISSAFEIMYTLGSDQAWRRYIPDRPDIPDTLTTLHQFDSVILLVTAEGGITWVFDS